MKKTLIFSLFLFSCQKQQLSKDECEKLSMKTFQGIPRYAHQFKTGCTEIKKDLHYSQKRCQDAMKDLVLNGLKSQLTKKHGALIMNCFTKNDLRTFLRK